MNYRGIFRTLSNKKIERLAKIGTGWKPLIISTKHSILDVCWGSKYAAVLGINPFHATNIFPYPRENMRNLISSVFTGYRKRSMTWNRLSKNKYLRWYCFGLLHQLQLFKHIRLKQVPAVKIKTSFLKNLF